MTYPWGYVLAGFMCQLDTDWGYHRERSFSWGKYLHEIQLWCIFSISDQGGKAPCGWDHIWDGSLGSIREQAEQGEASQ